MNKRIIMLSAVVLLTALGGVSAQPGRDGMRTKGMMDRKDKFDKEAKDEMKHHAKRWEHMMGELDLTKEQQEKIKDQRHKAERERIKDRSDMKLMMHDLKYELQNDDVDRKKVDKLIGQIGDMQKKMLQRRIDSMLDFRDILTKEQWDKIKYMKLKSFDRD